MHFCILCLFSSHVRTQRKFHLCANLKNLQPPEANVGQNGSCIQQPLTTGNRRLSFSSLGNLNVTSRTNKADNSSVQWLKTPVGQGLAHLRKRSDREHWSWKGAYKAVEPNILLSAGILPLLSAVFAFLSFPLYLSLCRLDPPSVLSCHDNGGGRQRLLCLC